MGDQTLPSLHCSKRKVTAVVCFRQGLVGQLHLVRSGQSKAGPQVLKVQKLEFNSSPRGDWTLGD